MSSTAARSCARSSASRCPAAAVVAAEEEEEEAVAVAVAGMAIAEEGTSAAEVMGTAHVRLLGADTVVARRRGEAGGGGAGRGRARGARARPAARPSAGGRGMTRVMAGAGATGGSELVAPQRPRTGRLPRGAAPPGTRAMTRSPGGRGRGALERLEMAVGEDPLSSADPFQPSGIIGGMA